MIHLYKLIHYIKEEKSSVINKNQQPMLFLPSSILQNEETKAAQGRDLVARQLSYKSERIEK